MAGTKTLTMIKPDGVRDGHIGAILNQINEAGFRISAMKLTQLSQADAEAFYAVHKERPFYGELVDFMTSGPIVAAILEKDNAVEDFRTLIGATNPAEAPPKVTVPEPVVLVVSFARSKNFICGIFPLPFEKDYIKLAKSV